MIPPSSETHNKESPEQTNNHPKTPRPLPGITSNETRKEKSPPNRKKRSSRALLPSPSVYLFLVVNECKKNPTSYSYKYTTAFRVQAFRCINPMTHSPSIKDHVDIISVVCVKLASPLCGSGLA
jgi:hypothetical protein